MEVIVLPTAREVGIAAAGIIARLVAAKPDAVLGLATGASVKPVYEERELGRAEIRAVFRSSKVGNIAGCLVTSGTIRRNSKARLLRDNVVVAQNLTVQSLRREKDDVTEVRDGYECGLTLTYSDIKEGDVVETYELVEKERS